MQPLSLDSLKVLSLATLTVGALIIIAFERLRPYNKQKFWRKGLVTDFLGYTVIQTYCMSLLIAWIAQQIDANTRLSDLRLIGDWPIWIQVVFLLFVHDLFIFGFHAWLHHSKHLWRLHEAHHSTPDVDWISGMRSHPLEILITQTVEFAPIILLGASPEVVIIKGTISGLWGMYIHSNIDVHTGWLQYIFNGPEMHRWHHALDPKAYNKNFATKFAFWDWIFGTAYLPPGQKAQSFGLGSEDADYPLTGYWRQTLHSMRRFKPDLTKPVPNAAP